ncbi:MACPF domain-containing protein CAD1 [Sesamum angolense]|uniref:MACPF domain-containing protein CAD1 n=1 Tax=Sesamum angolense TaxID=2727404 RepID=A0AAE2BVF5_9LAMI|nr:MACPF domain-containing protein CAD1 [Sesamum angolense]
MASSPNKNLSSTGGLTVPENALITTLCNSIQALGRGFDVTSDIRLLYCKGAPGSRLVHIDEEQTRNLEISESYVIPDVSVDIECSRGQSSNEKTPVWSFHEMAKYFNEKSSVPGHIPLGSFNAMFNFSGSWQLDAAATKSLAMVGYVIPLFSVELAKHNLVLRDEIKRAVPYSWDPASLASFIENYGTHIVTSATIGGRDIVYIRQHQSSPLSVADIENYVKDIGEQRFSDSKANTSAGALKYKDKDVTVIFRRRGGDDLEQSYARWARTVEGAPDVINMTFTPIVSLLEGVPGIKHLTRAIELYLEYKPPIEDLQYFLDFQISRVWAPEQNNLQRKEPVCPSLQFSLMGAKLYISPDQVTVGRKPVTGLKLSLEGSKQNRLAINLQHLVSLPKILQPHWDAHMAIGAPRWQGPEEQDSRWFEPIKWKNFSHVSTAPIEYTDTCIGDLSGVHIVTGAQLGVWDFGAKSVLHLKLLFSKVPGCTIRRSVWDHNPSNLSAAQKPDGSSSSLPNEKGDGSSQLGKLAKIVDMTEMSKGPQDMPGHWGLKFQLPMDKAELIEGKVDWRGKTAEKDKHGGSRASLFILGAFTFENMATMALAVNLVTYFTEVMHFNIADAANQLTNYMGTSYILTILMAFLADTYIGRFKTVLVAACIEALGLGLLALQAHYRRLKPPLCNIYDPNSKCIQVGGANAALLFVALYLVALGSGGVKSALPSHGADQFDDKDPEETKQKSSFFNWLLLALCVGGAISLTFFVWIQDHKGWDWGFAVSTLAMFFGIVIFAVGLPQYRYHVINGSSALTEILQVYVAAIRNRKLRLPQDSNQLYEINPDSEGANQAEFLSHTSAFRFLDKAAIQTSLAPDTPRPSPWKLCRVTQVENAKILLNMVPIFCCTIIMTLCLAQLQTFSIQQGVTMDTSITKHFKIPPASLPIIPVTFLVIIIPVYDRVFVPFARKFTGIPTGITHLQRVGVGLILSCLSMAVAAIVEHKRKQVAKDHNMLDAIPLLQPPIPISVFWLSFQYFIFGIADMFTYVGLLEFFYSQVPKDLKSISSCFLWTSMALGYFLSTIIVKIVNNATKDITRSGGWLAGNKINRGHLNLFYWLLSILSLLNFCIYLFVSTRYKYRQEIPEITSERRVHDLQNVEL